MSRRLGLMTKFFIVVIALSACGGSGGSGGSSAPSGPVATELQTTIDGWSFPNFPASAFPDTDFNETDLVSMFGSGEEICVGGVATPCKLTAEASAWARMVNQSRASGHCEGLVAIASTRFNNKEQPATVKLPSQDETLHALMRAFATQFLPEVQDAITLWLNKSLDEKVNELKNSFATGKLNYTLGLYTDGGGHALLPYAVEYPTPTTPKILLYDSNWPGKNRYVDIDLKAKTWRFSFSGEDPANDPEAWTGGPQDMDLTPLSAREGTCPFCGDGVKVAKTTMLIRSSNLDWSVETDGGVVSPSNPVGTDGTSVLPVKGAIQRDSYDYLVSVPTVSDPKSTTTVAAKKGKKARSKLKFSSSTSVYAMMPDGIAQFTTPGSANNPVEIEGSSISTKDPGVDLTLASGNLVANASGAAISLSVSGGEMAVSVTTASGQVVQQQVSEDKPTLQMKADPTGGGITVLAATSTGVVEKTAVSSTGVETKTIVKEVLNLSAVKAELPPELASKEIAALPSLANRNMANPNYKVDPVYTAPTTTAPKESSGNVSTKGAPQVPTVGKLVLPSVEFGDVPFTVQPPTSNSKGEWKFSSSKPDIAQINASTGRVTIAGAGTSTITATQAAVKDFESISVTAELTVARATPVLGSFTTTSRTVGEEAFALASPTSTSSAVFKMESSDESVAKFSRVNGKLSIVGAGKTTITATQPANDDFLAASKNFVLTVRKGTPVLSAIAELSSTFGEVGPAIGKPTSESRGAVTFTSSNTAVATVNATTGQVSVVGAGTTTITATQAATDDYVSATQTMTFTVKQAVPTLGKITADSKTFGDGEFSITKPTSLSSGTFTFTSSDSKVVKITEEGKVTIAGAGTATITATQAAAGNYASNSVKTEITIAKATPELSNISLTGLVFGDADSTMEPRSTSSGAFTFSSNNTRVLTVNEKTGRVRIVGAGTATITVKQASTTNYEAASSSVTVQVGLATPAFQRLDPIAKDFGDANFLFDWGTSPSDGVITYTSSNPDAATINATTGRVTIVSTGITTLTMSQAKGTNHTAATTVAVLTISRGLPVYGDFVIDNKTYGAAPFLLTPPTTTSSGAFTFTTRKNGTLNDTSVATVNSSTGLVTIVAPGSVEIIATQLATLTHTASTSTTTFVVNAASPTFGSFVAPAKTFGDAIFTMSAPSSSSSGAFTFISSNTNVATINSSSGAVTIVGAGSTTITASQAASSPYAARSTTATFTVAKATAPLSGFGGTCSSNVDNTTGVNIALASNGECILSFATAATTPTTSAQSATRVWTVPSWVTSVKAVVVAGGGGGGSSNGCCFDAGAGGGGGVVIASGFPVTPGQSITVKTGLGGSGTYCGNGYNGGNSEFGSLIAVGGGRGGGCGVSVGSGGSGGGAHCLSSAGSSTQSSAGTSSNGSTILVYGRAGGLSTQCGSGGGGGGGGATEVGAPGIGNGNTGPNGGVGGKGGEGIADSTRTGSAIVYGSGGGGQGYWKNSAGGTNAGSGSGTNASGGAGIDGVDETGGGGGAGWRGGVAGQAAGDGGSGIVVIRYSGGGLSKTVGDQPFTPTIPSSVSTGAITYSSSNPAVAAINPTSGLITVLSGGTTTISAEQAATDNYNSSTVTTTLTVLSNPTISAMSVLTKNYNDAAFTLPAPTTNSDGAISYASSNTSVATINATTGRVTIVGGGNTTITASVSATSTYAAGSATTSLVVLSNPMLSSESSITKTPDTAPFTLTAPSTSSNGAISYTSSNTAVATINETTRLITLVGNGTTTITISQLATSTYAAASTTTTLTVSNMQSCLDIKNSTGTNTNGTYTISLNVSGTVTNTQVYCLMDSAMSGGGWTLTMKAPRNSTSFAFDANYWTTANTLNVSNLGNVTTDATNAKFNTFNYLSGTEMLAIFPDAGINGGSVTGHTYGWTWKTTIPSGPKTPLAIFSGPAEQFISDAFTFGGFDTRIWTRQADIRFYGFNYNGNQKARWGFGWNENGGGLWPNGIRGSDDATGGIGLYHGSFSAADGSFCCTLSTGLNRSMSFETYIR